MKEKRIRENKNKKNISQKIVIKQQMFYKRDNDQCKEITNTVKTILIESKSFQIQISTLVTWFQEVFKKCI